MLDIAVIKEFLNEEFDDLDLKIPEDVSRSSLVETFCHYTEDDYYDWLKDNFKSFFEHGNPDWNWIRNKIKYYQGQ